MIRLVWVLIFASQLAWADARQVDEFHWTGVERIVAIGDLHGDYDNYLATLSAAGLVNKKGKWSGGKTHLVQTGDIPDRGPDTKKIIEHITKLAKQAKRKGGAVHSLIGNHEAMNMYGDLRYVHPGEYAAFVNRGSESIRDRYFEAFITRLETQDPETFAALPENYREEWNTKYPLGWVEHRMAWDPAWNPEAEFGEWVLDKKIAIRVNNAVFLHGGLSGFYCQDSLESITRRAHDNLRNFDPATPGVIEDGYGPLWYRGLSGMDPDAPEETVDAILAHQGVDHIVVGHTPTQGVIWPNYDAKVIMIDTGIAKAYGGHIGYLEITQEGLIAGYPETRIPIPTSDSDKASYLEKVIAQDPDNDHLKKRLTQLQAVPAPEPAAADVEPGLATRPEVVPPAVPICGTRQ